MNVLMQLAFRNIRGAGLRTWLNVGTLSFGFVFVVCLQGLVNGMMRHMEFAQISAEYGGGQYWHKNYNPLEPFTLRNSYGTPGAFLQKLIEEERATAVLISTGFVEPKGRRLSVVMRGILPEQKIVRLPTHVLASKKPLAFIGSRMAHHTGLQKGDTVTLKWMEASSDRLKTLDFTIAYIMSTPVVNLDTGQIWLSIHRLRDMMNLPPQSASLLITEKGYSQGGFVSGQNQEFVFKSLDFLLKDERAVFESKTVSNMIIYFFLIGMGLLAVFDTQVLAIFRRRKEIGTLMALGLNRLQVIFLFTFEGSLHGLLAMLVGAVWGIPLMVYAGLTGFPLPQMTDSYGYAMGVRLYAVYAPGVLLATLVLLLVSVVVVSFLPARKISKMKAGDIIRGKI